MRTLVVVLAVLAVSGTAYAGPNAGVQLHVHGNYEGVATNGDPCLLVPANCEDFVPWATNDVEEGLDWFIMVVVSPPENTPNFDTAVFGIGDYSTACAYPGYWGPCWPVSPLYTTDPPFPWPNSGVAVTERPECQTGYVEPIFWICFYDYCAQDVPLHWHPTQGENGSGVSDCSGDPVLDPFVAYGIMGVSGAQGDNPPCPGQVVMGACCDGPVCHYITEDECLGNGWEYVGDNVPCENPNPCEEPPPTAVQETTWGSIKNIYR